MGVASAPCGCALGSGWEGVHGASTKLQLRILLRPGPDTRPQRRRRQTKEYCNPTTEQQDMMRHGPACGRAATEWPPVGGAHASYVRGGGAHGRHSSPDQPSHGAQSRRVELSAPSRPCAQPPLLPWPSPPPTHTRHGATATTPPPASKQPPIYFCSPTAGAAAAPGAAEEVAASSTRRYSSLVGSSSGCKKALRRSTAAGGRYMSWCRSSTGGYSAAAAAASGEAAASSCWPPGDAAAAAARSCAHARGKVASWGQVGGGCSGGRRSGRVVTSSAPSGLFHHPLS